MRVLAFTMMTIFLAPITYAATIEGDKNYFNETLKSRGDGQLFQNRFIVYQIQIPATIGVDQGFNMISILYDTALETTVSATALYSMDNTNQGTRPPSHNWRRFDDEVDCSLGAPYPTGYERGHLIPSCYWQWTPSVRLATFYCLNQAPQNINLNRGWWSHTVEVELAALAKQRNGFIMTGVSEATLDTVSGHRIPLYFWKLVCTWNPTTGQAEVYGYYARNDATTDVRVCGSQATIAQFAMGPNYRAMLGIAWALADADLRGNRNINGALPTGLDCANAVELPAGVCLRPYSDFDQCSQNCCVDEEE
ncbi:uncharacterized protein LOC110859694 [Folsomia candida]|uniref:Nuclease n=1 Tax=Folsomia candida TaxID=158441 RepID=A0A226D997_FOLCA|nr:uncharacterized protein LOC110859694 [Folsomia candida]OXA42125.1 Nuclease [Folsomia candida]